MNEKQLGWVYDSDVLCLDCSSQYPDDEHYKALTEANVANKEDQCLKCNRIYRDGQWLEQIEKEGSKTKGGEELWLHIDPHSDPYCSVTLWSLGYAIVFAVETPEQATALYEALLNVTDIEAD